MTIKISLVEDDARMRNYISEIIRESISCTLVGVACSGKDAKEIIKKNETDIYLIDLGLPDIDGVELISLIAEMCSGAQSLVISTFGDSKHISSSIRAGAAGYLLKEDFGHNLIIKIIDLRNGIASITPSLVKYLFEKVAEAGEVPKTNSQTKYFKSYSLANRELEVLNYLVKGRSIYVIADTLGITPHTVNQHLRSIYKKLNVHSRSMAVYVALNNGFTEF